MPSSRHQVRPIAKAKDWSMSAAKRLWIRVRNELESFLLLADSSTRRGPDSNVDVFLKSVLCFPLVPRENLDISSASPFRGSRDVFLRDGCAISNL